MTLAVLMLGAFALAWLLTGAIRRWALRTNLLDVPNERSSHTTPTPRGGGLAIVLAFFVGLTALAGLQGPPTPLLLALSGAGVLVAVLGLADDRWSLPASWRMAGHLLAAAWVLWQLGPLPEITLLGRTFDPGVAGWVLALLYLVWAINLFNFMDGIDGIASVEAITVAVGGSLLGWLTVPASPWSVGLLFAAATAGFLVWNFPPARIFMGDAGSGFIGLAIGTLSLANGYHDPALFWAWFALQGCFFVDATTTLLRRVRRGERVHQAHRTHAYQYASRKYRSHRTVTLAYGGLTLGWLLPLACAIALHRLDGPLGVLLAHGPLVALAFLFKAGDRAAQGA